jgi:hypothetical protein
MGKRHSGMSVKKLRKLIENSIANGTDLIADLQAEFDQWQEDRVNEQTDNEVIRASGAITKFAYIGAGITMIRWVSSNDSCEFCQGLDGMVVGIESSFVRKDEEYKPEGASGSMTPSSNISHPPIHRGCSCSIVAET